MTAITIGRRAVGEGAPAYLVAEAGSNHNRDLQLALRLIDAAADVGADAVKFQTFRADALYARSSSSVEYLERLGLSKSIYDIIADCELPVDWIPELAARCRDRQVDFLSTPFDERSADLLAPHVPAFKIASYELTHLPLVRHVARLGKPMIVSTGAATLDEIDDTVDAIRAVSTAGLVLTQCTACYPAPPDSLNLRAIPALRARYGVPVGLSDHSLHPVYAPTAAVALGACLVEKHYTLDRHLPGPDHSFAVEPHELGEMVRAVRSVEALLGDGIKRPLPAEAELVNFRRSVFAARDLRAGEVVDAASLVILRRSGAAAPDLRPADVDAVIGRRVVRDLAAQTMLSWNDFEAL